MIKKMLPFVLVLFFCGGSVFGFEVGVTAGTMSKAVDSGFHYGIAGGTGMLVPMLKFEIEYYKIKDTGSPGKSNTLSLGIKFRPKFGKFAPYGIVGVGGEFDSFGFRFSEYNKFSFFGGGLHFFLKGMISLRGDIRFLNYSDSTRTRFSAGIFIHI